MAAYMGEASAPRTSYARAPRIAPPIQAMPAPMPAPAQVVAAPAPIVVEAPVAAAPVAVAAPAPAPAPAAPVAPPPPAPQPVAAAPASAGVQLGREQLADMLLGIIEEKTGYPRDMVGLDQGLEADLGIDSIKRIEVVGAMLQALPEQMREALAPNRSKLNTQATLDGMLDILVQATPEAGAKAGGSVRELHADERKRA